VRNPLLSHKGTICLWYSLQHDTRLAGVDALPKNNVPLRASPGGRDANLDEIPGFAQELPRDVSKKQDMQKIQSAR
jgi:hypothetical protein